MEIDRTIQPSVQPMHPFQVPVPERRILKNGIPLHIIRAGSQEVVRLDVLIGAGRWQQKQLLQALFTNRMLREGTASYSSKTIASKLDYYGSWLELNITVQHAWITLYSLNKHFPHTLSVIESLLKEPSFPEEQLEVVLATNKHQYLINQSKVAFLSQKGFREAIFGHDHPLGATAEEEDYDRVSTELLKAFYREYYHSGNCFMYLSGYVTDDLVQKVEDVLGNSPWGEVKPCQRPLPVQIQTAQEKRIHLPKADAMQSSVRMGWPTIPSCHPDFLKLRVLITVLGGYFGSRLMSNIREEKGFTYGISAMLNAFPDTGLVTISSETATEHVEALIGEVYREMEILRQELVPAEELEMVRNYMLGEIGRTYEGAFSLADAWINIELTGLPEDRPAQAMQAIQEVTAEELRELARTYFVKESVFEVVAGQ